MRAVSAIGVWGRSLCCGDALAASWSAVLASAHWGQSTSLSVTTTDVSVTARCPPSRGRLVDSDNCLSSHPGLAWVLPQFPLLHNEMNISKRCVYPQGWLWQRNEIMRSAQGWLAGAARVLAVKSTCPWHSPLEDSARPHPRNIWLIPRPPPRPPTHVATPTGQAVTLGQAVSMWLQWKPVRC